MKIAIPVLILFLAGCGATGTDIENGSNGDTDPNGETDPNGDQDHNGDQDPKDDDEPNGDQEPEREFNPDDPGIHMFLDMGALLMMGDPMELCAGGFMPAAREDFDSPEDGEEIPLNTCVVVTQGDGPGPECTTDADCYPEQVCEPRYDNDEQPIPDSEHCVTPRDLMDVGPLTITGFNGGPQTLQYNPGQQGAYTTADPGDGQLPPGTIAYDTTYTIEGGGDPAQGLGPFEGEIRVGPQLQLTSPPMTDVMGGMPGIQVNPNQDLVLEWTGEDQDGELRITLSGASMMGDDGSIECRVTDDGKFTIPQEKVAAANLGDMAFLNMLNIERLGTGFVAGEGMTHHEIGMIQGLMLNVAVGGN